MPQNNVLILTDPVFALPVHRNKVTLYPIQGERESKKWSSYQYLGKTGSVIPTASLAGTEVSVDEIRSAATVSDLYPPSLHAPLITSPEPYSNGLSRTKT